MLRADSFGGPVEYGVLFTDVDADVGAVGT